MKKGYNGFSTSQRRRANKWINAKNLPSPKECQICGQTEGQILYHTEDYSEPYGEHIGKYKLCYLCHTMLLIRNGPRMREKFEEYKNKIVNGFTFHHISTWPRFKILFVDPPKIEGPFYFSTNRNRRPMLLGKLEKEGDLLTKKNINRIKERKKAKLAV